MVHLLAAIGAVGFALHLLLDEKPVKHEPVVPARTHEIEEPYSQSALDNVPAPRAGASPSGGAARPWPPPVDSTRLEPATEPDAEAALREVAKALPHTERDSQRLKLLEVRALVKQGKVGAARAEAQDYFGRWPSGPDVPELQQLTGAHPTR